MAKGETEPVELTYPLRTAARLTGLSPEVLRAWERRHGVVVPHRTPGGTRRYTAADLERLRLVKAAVDAGHRVGKVAKLAPDELERIAATPSPLELTGHLDGVLGALDALDGAEAQRLLALQLSALGPVRFAKDIAGPLVCEIGARWANDEMGVASEHLATGVIRSMLGSALQPTATSLLGPRIVFATPSGERHELGLLMAALTALGSGANPLYLGPDVPVEDLLGAVETSRASALGLGIVSLPAAQAERCLGALRGALAPEISVWVGGARSAELSLPDGVECIEDLATLEQRVALLVAADPRAR